MAINQKCILRLEGYEVVIPQCGIKHGDIVANICIAYKPDQNGCAKIVGGYRSVCFSDSGFACDHFAAQKQLGACMTPDEFESFIQTNLQAIRGRIKELLEDDSRES